MTTKPQPSCSSIIEAMVAHILENQEQITALRSGQVILDFAPGQVALKVLVKTGFKKVKSSNPL